jgi:hypothetical protein
MDLFAAKFAEAFFIPFRLISDAGLPGYKREVRACQAQKKVLS